MKANILVAYPYFTKAVYETLKKYKNQVNLLLDSGAFTAHSKGKVITLDEYCNFVKSLDIPVWKYFMLDVIGNAEKTKIQYQEMLNRNFNPIPIFTQGQKFEDLDLYHQTSDLIGIGSLVGTKNNKEYIKYIMKKTKDKHLHWLGFTNLDFIKKFKPFSCDSSSFMNGERYGHLKLYMGKGKSLLLKRKDFVKMPSTEIQKRIQFYGYNPVDLSKAINWTGARTNSCLNAASFVALMIDIKKNLGTNFFLAVTQPYQIEMIMKEYFYQTKQEVA